MANVVGNYVMWTMMTNVVVTMTGCSMMDTHPTKLLNEDGVDECGGDNDMVQYD